MRTCGRCGLDLGRPGSGITPSVTPTATGTEKARSPVGRRLLLGIGSIAVVVILGATLLMISDAPERVRVSAPAGASPQPVAATGDVQPTAPTSVSGPARTITGALTIVDPAGSPMESGMPDPLDTTTEAEPPWVPVKAELGEPIALHESAEPDPDRLPEADETTGCVGAADFSDFAPGRTVTILNERAEIIATSALEVGSIAASGRTYGCRLPFTFVGVPPAASYTIDLGRGALTYTREQLDALGWNIEFEVGPRR